MAVALPRSGGSMRSLAVALSLLLSTSAAARPVLIGVDVGVTAVEKAASHGFIVTPGVHVDVPVGPRLSVGFQSTIGRFGESNPAGTQVTTPLRLSATLDGRLYRQSLAVYGGIGPALRVVSTRLQGGSAEFSGTRVGPGLRVRTGVTGDIGRRLQWGIGVGAVAHATGADWDSLASLSFALGGG